MPAWLSDFLQTALLTLMPLLVSAALLLLLAVCASLVVYLMGVIALCRKAVDVYLEKHTQS